MFKPKVLLVFVFCLLGFFGQYSQAQSIPSSQIYHQLLQIKETKRVLYIAAHPDDENTRLIAYLVNGVHAEVAYLSLTRGDGGQNLIGKELGIELGQIRTQELIKARETDGGRQFFTRAMDFGYSKNPTETLQNWEKEKVLADVVWAIRKFQPDIIITRFNTIPGVTHGHHTTSAILAEEAFQLAGKPEAFPDQLQWVKPWQPKRIFFNAYNFRGDFEPEDGKKYHAFEVGGYNPLLGKTYNQIAADSRTMHKSQGFGATAGIGLSRDFIEQVDGEDYVNGPFDGVNDRWESISGGKEIRAKLDRLISEFDFLEPEKNITGLLELRAALLGLNSQEMWLKEKVEKLDRAIFYGLGLEFEFNVRKEIGFPGEKINAELVINNPSAVAITNINFKVDKLDFSGKAEELKDNRTQILPISFTIPADASYSQPYWLENSIEGALYDVKDQRKIGMPFNETTTSGNLHFEIGTQKFFAVVPLKYKFNDQVDGEVKQPFTIVPEVDLTVSKENVFLVSGADPTVTVTVSFRDQYLEGELDFEGIDSTQFRILSIEDLTLQKRRVYKVGFLPNGIGKKTIIARFTTPNGKSFNQLTKSISYKHIPNLTYFSPASFNLIQADWKLSGEKIGYIPGAGDDVPGVLSALGYKVTMIGPEDYSVDYLSQFKAIIVGIRAFNTNQILAANQQNMMGYVRSGGNLIVQYNTSSPLLTSQIGPYPFTVGRDRVAVQNSPVLADWKSPVLATPNQLNEEDLTGWVQERGLYFATAIDPAYQTPLTMQDPDEPASNGALIVANYGNGTFVYTGISFFRQLPAGVPGAIKLFINLIEQ
ncbi:MAG: PIG-L family deacetylase [Algoriphagus sp.]|uniref:PIG-L family deacetylase n=1 Tax=Algoriphagus sp. TaxID=1872435 RepID=UPI00273000A1|nr:PIG-L family deacetylase [Algoriphagus sp.]MDP2042224.1 PIG-L family deacetylase [Algoriphagus sp.]MDP3471285.1 PIG-L family deacetylase [Algoriphagus sp.]